MGVHLILQRPGNYTENEEWLRDGQFENGGHKHFARNVLPDLPKIEISDGDDYDFEWLIRPKDFAAWRAAIDADPQLNGKSNLHLLIDILEREPDFWLFVSQ